VCALFSEGEGLSGLLRNPRSRRPKLGCVHSGCRGRPSRRGLFQRIPCKREHWLPRTEEDVEDNCASALPIRHPVTEMPEGIEGLQPRMQEPCGGARAGKSYIFIIGIQRNTNAILPAKKRKPTMIGVTRKRMPSWSANEMRFLNDSQQP
jgi:hypothetical protein